MTAPLTRMWPCARAYQRGEMPSQKPDKRYVVTAALLALQGAHASEKLSSLHEVLMYSAPEMLDARFQQLQNIVTQHASADEAAAWMPIWNDVATAYAGAA